MRPGTHNQRGTGHSRRTHAAVVELVVGQLLELATRLDDGTHAEFAEEVDPAIGKDGRSTIVAAEAMLPELSSRGGIDARGNAGLIHHEDQVADQQLRRTASDILITLPI